jgi:hypothetical protein
MVCVLCGGIAVGNVISGFDLHLLVEPTQGLEEF